MFKFIPVSGNDAVWRKMIKIEPRIERGIRKGWYDVAEDWRRTTSREILRHPKAGKRYRLRKRPGSPIITHTASAPGETHADLTGDTRRSLSWKIRGHTEMTVGYGVASNSQGQPTPYGRFLEFGTRRMSARPSIQNGLNTTVRNGQTYFVNDIIKVINTR